MAEGVRTRSGAGGGFVAPAVAADGSGGTSVDMRTSSPYVTIEMLKEVLDQSLDQSQKQFEEHWMVKMQQMHLDSQHKNDERMSKLEDRLDKLQDQLKNQGEPSVNAILKPASQLVPPNNMIPPQPHQNAGLNNAGPNAGKDRGKAPEIVLEAGPSAHIRSAEVRPPDVEVAGAFVRSMDSGHNRYGGLHIDRHQRPPDGNDRPRLSSDGCEHQNRPPDVHHRSESHEVTSGGRGYRQPRVQIEPFEGK